MAVGASCVIDDDGSMSDVTRLDAGGGQVGIDELRDPHMTVIYGEDACEDTTRAREHFDTAGRSYRYVRLDQETATRQRLHEADYLATPVIMTPAGGIFVEPSDQQLAAILDETA